MKNKIHKKAIVTYVRNTRERIINNSDKLPNVLFYIKWLSDNNKINSTELFYMYSRVIRADYERKYIENSGNIRRMYK